WQGVGLLEASFVPRMSHRVSPRPGLEKWAAGDSRCGAHHRPRGRSSSLSLATRMGPPFAKTRDHPWALRNGANSDPKGCPSTALALRSTSYGVSGGDQARGWSPPAKAREGRLAPPRPEAVMGGSPPWPRAARRGPDQVRDTAGSYRRRRPRHRGRADHGYSRAAFYVVADGFTEPGMLGLFDEYLDARTQR